MSTPDVDVRAAILEALPSMEEIRDMTQPLRGGGWCVAGSSLAWDILVTAGFEVGAFSTTLYAVSSEGVNFVSARGNGHVVLLVDGDWLVDVSAYQVNTERVPVEPLIIVEKVEGDSWVIVSQPGCMLVYGMPESLAVAAEWDFEETCEWQNYCRGPETHPEGWAG